MISKWIQCLCYGIGVRLDHIDLSHPIHLPVDYEYMQHDMTYYVIVGSAGVCDSRQYKISVVELKD